MTKIEFYFDPICPFCWITSRWLHQVIDRRDVEVDWRPFSLAIKNNVVEPTTDDGEHADRSRSSLRLLRLISAAARDHSADIGKLYTAAGIKHHVAGFAYDDTMFAQLLDEFELPTELIASADDSSFDAEIEQTMQAVLDIAGQDIGVPAIVFVNNDGSRQGYFGPVLNTLPEIDESLDLWDGLSKLATNKSFYELKRTRPSGDPDVFSTAKC